MSKRYQGNIITDSPTDPTTSAASGVWSIGEAEAFTRGGLWPSPPLYLTDLGIIAGGYDGSSNVNVIQYIFVATTGNAVDFGDLTAAGRLMGTTSSQTRALFFGGVVLY